MTVPGTGKPRLLGHADERVPESAPGRPQPRDTPIDELIETIIAPIRAVRPALVFLVTRNGAAHGRSQLREHDSSYVLATLSLPPIRACFCFCFSAECPPSDYCLIVT